MFVLALSGIYKVVIRVSGIDRITRRNSHFEITEK